MTFAEMKETGSESEKYIATFCLAAQYTINSLIEEQRKLKLCLKMAANSMEIIKISLNCGQLIQAETDEVNKKQIEDETVLKIEQLMKENDNAEASLLKS